MNILDDIKFHKRQRQLQKQLSKWRNVGDELELTLIHVHWAQIPKWQYNVSLILSYLFIL